MLIQWKILYHKSWPIPLQNCHSPHLYGNLPSNYETYYYTVIQHIYRNLLPYQHMAETEVPTVIGNSSKTPTHACTTTPLPMATQCPSMPLSATTPASPTIAVPAVTTKLKIIPPGQVGSIYQYPGKQYVNYKELPFPALISYAWAESNNWDPARQPFLWLTVQLLLN